MLDIGLLVAIICSLVVGYFIADLQGQKSVLKWLRGVFRRVHGKPELITDTHYYGVLTSLLNEQSDEALDAFVSAMDVNIDTLEMHLALGGLLRRRGEFGRALRVHQNLLSRPGLPAEKFHHVKLELACDYWRSGLLDRAELLLKEILQAPTVHSSTRWQASAYLLEIYQDLGEWLSAIDIADSLTAKKFATEPDLWRQLQAQFCCELAEQAMATKRDDDLAASKLRLALNYDPNCVRANLLKANFSIHTGHLNAALAALEAVPNQNTALVSELIEPLQRCFSRAEDVDELIAALKKLLAYDTSVLLLTTLTELLYLHEGEASARACWLRYLDERNEMASQADVIRLALAEKGDQPFQQRLAIVNNMLKEQLLYRCNKCGFSLSKLKWRCPSCHSWATFEHQLASRVLN